jgi:hypothetical protein
MSLIVPESIALRVDCGSPLVEIEVLGLRSWEAF